MLFFLFSRAFGRVPGYGWGTMKLIPVTVRCIGGNRWKVKPYYAGWLASEIIECEFSALNAELFSRHFIAI